MDQIIIVDKTVIKKYLRGNLTGIDLNIGLGSDFKTFKIAVIKPVVFVGLSDMIIRFLKYLASGFDR